MSEPTSPPDPIGRSWSRAPMLALVIPSFVVAIAVAVRTTTAVNRGKEEMAQSYAVNAANARLSRALTDGTDVAVDGSELDLASYRTRWDPAWRRVSSSWAALRVALDTDTESRDLASETEQGLDAVQSLGSHPRRSLDSLQVLWRAILATRRSMAAISAQQDRRFLVSQSATDAASRTRSRMIAFLLAMSMIGVALLYLSASRGRKRRLESQAQLARERVRYRAVIDALGEGLVVHEASGRLTEWNESAKHILGLTDDQLAGRSSYSPEWRAITRGGAPLKGEDHPAMITLRTGQALNRAPMGISNGDGVITWLEVNTRLLPPEESTHNEAAAVATFLDVTERYQLDDALTRQAAIFDSTSDFVGIMTTSGEPLFLNRAGRTLLGIREDESLGGRPLASVHPARELAYLKEHAIPEAFALGSWRGETVVINASGDHVPMSQVLLAHRDVAGTVESLSTVMRDISQERAAIWQQARLVERWSALVRLAPVGIFETDKSGHCDFVNTRWCDLTGLTPAQAAGTGWTSALHPDDKARVFAEWESAQSSGAEFRSEYRFMRPNGECRWVVGSASALFDPDGSVRGHIGTVADVSELKRAGEQMAMQTLELARSNDDLDRFASVASHDLQEPLRIISGYTQLLAKRYRGKLDGEADMFMQHTVDGAARMQRLIKDLLHFARLSQSKSTVREPVALGESVAGAMDDLALAINDAGAKIVCSGLPTVYGDAILYQQIFRNLIGNAIKYRSSKLVDVSISATREVGAWHLVVRDNGIGIAPEYHDSVFAPFRRLHAASHAAGTGMGLSICRRIIEQNGGRIWVESVLGQGSAFHIVLPDSGGVHE